MKPLMGEAETESGSTGRGSAAGSALRNSSLPQFPQRASSEKALVRRKAASVVPVAAPTH